jgi:hypothetical protein
MKTKPYSHVTYARNAIDGDWCFAPAYDIEVLATEMAVFMVGQKGDAVLKYDYSQRPRSQR